MNSPFELVLSDCVFLQATLHSADDGLITAPWDHEPETIHMRLKRSSVISRLLQRPNSWPSTRPASVAAETDGDRVLTMQEISHNKAATADYAARIFRAADANGDERLSLHEINAYIVANPHELAALSVHLQWGELMQLMQDDKDRDDEWRILIDDWVEYYVCCMEQLQPTPVPCDELADESALREEATLLFAQGTAQLTSHLQQLGLAQFEGRIRDELGVTEPADIPYVNAEDLAEIGMSPAQAETLLATPILEPTPEPTLKRSESPAGMAYSQRLKRSSIVCRLLQKDLVSEGDGMIAENDFVDYYLKHCSEVFRFSAQTNPADPAELQAAAVETSTCPTTVTLVTSDSSSRIQSLPVGFTDPEASQIFSVVNTSGSGMMPTTELVQFLKAIEGRDTVSAAHVIELWDAEWSGQASQLLSLLPPQLSFHLHWLLILPLPLYLSCCRCCLLSCHSTCIGC